MNEMVKIGMVVAVGSEMDSVLRRYGEPLRQETHGTFELRLYRSGENELYILHSGMGESAAAAATQLLISLCQVDLIVNFGVVGGLTEEMAKQKTCIVEKVVHADYDAEAVDGTKRGQYAGFPDEFIPTDPKLFREALRIEPDLKPVICASADKFIAGREKKSELHDLFGAEICDMESAGIALTCYRNRIPCLMIKTVSDGITGGAEEYYAEVAHTSALCLDIAQRIIEEAL